MKMFVLSRKIHRKYKRSWDVLSFMTKTNQISKLIHGKNFSTAKKKKNYSKPLDTTLNYSSGIIKLYLPYVHNQHNFFELKVLNDNCKKVLFVYFLANRQITIRMIRMIFPEKELVLFSITMKYF